VIFLVEVSVKNLWMSFGKVVALKGISLHIKEGEIVTLLGPSGCGKTTLLRIIAGLYKPNQGQVFFNNKDVTNVPPWERNVGLVFQDYALWPHMTVYENIAYGLKLRKVQKEDIYNKIKYIASLLRIEDLLERYPHQLSGGQQQRVALARAIVVNPNVLLLDEPLSNLDAKVRVNVRTEIRKLQKKLKTTTVYVTHDQEEALVISDRIAVMNIGTVEQIGTPAEIYYNPRTPFVADFVGQVNMIFGKLSLLSSEKNTFYVDTEIGKFLLSLSSSFKDGDSVYLVFRPEDIQISKNNIQAENGSVTFKGQVSSIHFLGNLLRAEVNVNNSIIKVEVHNPIHSGMLSEGDTVYLKLRTDNIRVLSQSDQYE
jgi:iron(III) transport system ATP-binding protein